MLLSRLDDLAPALPEDLLQPGEPLFEYWGHEACWMPLRLYPHFAFRRAAYREHPWWRDIIEPNRAEADALLARIAEHGPVRSAELEGEADGGWWGWKASKKIAAALWRSGELAIRERRGFQRSYDLAERVIPGALRDRPLDEADALPELLLLALGGHGWAAESTLRATWRLTGRGPALRSRRDEGVERRASEHAGRPGGKEDRRPHDQERQQPAPDRHLPADAPPVLDVAALSSALPSHAA